MLLVGSGTSHALLCVYITDTVVGNRLMRNSISMSIRVRMNLSMNISMSMSTSTSLIMNNGVIMSMNMNMSTRYVQSTE